MHGISFILQHIIMTQLFKEIVNFLQYYDARLISSVHVRNHNKVIQHKKVIEYHINDICICAIVNNHVNSNLPNVLLWYNTKYEIPTPKRIPHKYKSSA